MPGFFDKNIVQSPERTMLGVQKLTAGGTLSEAALAVLEKPQQPDGGTAEPDIVDPAVQANNIKAELKKNAMYLLAYTAAVIVAVYALKKL